MIAQLEIVPGRDLTLPCLDVGIDELLHTTAVQAYDMVMVVSFIHLEYRHRPFEVMASDQAGGFELGQHTVNRSEPNIVMRFEQTFVDVFRTQVARIRGDSRAVKQILLNFLSNAVKFTPEGGFVRVLASLDEHGRYCLAVQDSGIGMTDAETKIALSPFGQIDSGLARKHEGTGLGLPICKSLMELHEGEVVIASAPNKGTTLTAWFPASRVILDRAA